MEIGKKKFFKVYNSSTSLLSKVPSNSSNFSFKSRSFSIKFANLKGGFTTYPQIIGPIFAHKNQFIQKKLL